MTKQEPEDIKARALLRLHEVTHKADAHRTRIREMASQLESVASSHPESRKLLGNKD